MKPLVFHLQDARKLFRGAFACAFAKRLPKPWAHSKPRIH